MHYELARELSRLVQTAAVKISKYNYPTVAEGIVAAYEVPHCLCPENQIMIHLRLGVAKARLNYIILLS